MSRFDYWCGVGALIVALSIPGAAWAQDQPAEEAPAEEAAPAKARVEIDATDKKGDFRLDISAGVKGGLNGAWALEVPENAMYRINSETKSYYPMFGLGGDFGLSVDARALGIVGLETGVKLSFDNAQGYNELNDAGSGQLLVRINQEQKTTSMRFPVLLKLSAPDGVVRPTLGLGIEFAAQTDSSITYSVDEINATEPESVTQRREERNQIEASNYKLATLTLGIEIDMGPVKVPIELRAQYNLDYGGESFEDRVRVEQPDGGQAIYYYDGAYQGHFGVTIGVLYDHELWM